MDRKFLKCKEFHAPGLPEAAEVNTCACASGSPLISSGSLKLLRSTPAFSAFAMFQFHIGAIRRSTHPLELSRRLGFQFHIGAIRSTYPDRVVSKAALFQFHIGAIRRGEKERAVQVKAAFQFHIGELAIRRINSHEVI